MVIVILLVGATVVLAILVKASLERIGVPALIGYMGLGFLLRLVGTSWGLLSEEMREVYAFLADVGIICLLFRVGLESHIQVLVRQLKGASLLWIGNVVCSGVLGYVTAYFFLDLGLIPSLILATALTATSVAVSIGIWQEAHALNSTHGALLLDVAELDDISGIILMGLLFAVIVALKNDAAASLLAVSLTTLLFFLLKLLAFGAFCMLFSRYLEIPMTRFFQRIEPPPDAMLLVAGVAFMITALAGLLGFSVAIGAFFAGLVFSRDPQSVHLDASFSSIYDLFTPFFFVGIGLHIDPDMLTPALGLGAPLLVVAVLGKIVGTSLPALFTTGGSSALLLGVSMVPRAEIAMVIMQRGLMLGDWAVPARVFAAMALVSAVTCMFTPFVVHTLLRKRLQ
jgi:Kef-type K+ transport system membrane component KefB